jgi:hypothetical protein
MVVLSDAPSSLFSASLAKGKDHKSSHATLMVSRRFPVFSFVAAGALHGESSSRFHAQTLWRTSMWWMGVWL